MSPYTIADLKLKHLHSKIMVKWIFNDIWRCRLTSKLLICWVLLNYGHLNRSMYLDSTPGSEGESWPYVVELIYKPLMIWNTMVWVWNTMVWVWNTIAVITLSVASKGTPHQKHAPTHLPLVLRAKSVEEI